MRVCQKLESTSLGALVSLCIGALMLTAACDVGLTPNTGGGNGDGDGEVPVCESYPLGEPRDPDTLDACCTGGDAHCLPSDVVPDFLRGLVAECDSGGVCVPDPFISKGGLHVPKDCTVDLDGTTGVCMSKCIPEVGQYDGILKQDVCNADELCTPCVSPLDGSDTGACALRENICGADISGGGGGGGGGVCPHEGPPLIDPASFPTCDQCGDASCVDTNLVPVEFQGRLNACDANSLCVPNELVETAGNFIPTTCTAVAGFEGRCLSECLPEVQERADLLDQSSCAAAQLCVPCYDPLTGEATGACDLSCDIGPDPTGPTALPNCCEGRGTCVPGELAGDDADQLGEDSCPEDSGLLCAPDEMIAGTFTATSCTTGGLVGGGQDGACLPDCLGAVDSILVGQGDCSDGFKCAPCEGPFGGDTGACDYLAP